MAVMGMNKRGFFFSFLALLLLFIMVMATQPTSYSGTYEAQQFVQDRVIVTNNMIYNFRQGFLSNIVNFEGYSALEALALYRNNTGTLYTSKTALEDDFRNAILYGNITNSSGQNQSLKDIPGIPAGIMPSVSLIDLLKQYSELAYQSNKINFTFSEDEKDYDIKLYQDNKTGPFAVGVNLTMHYTVDAGAGVYEDNIAKWNITSSVPVKIQIEGLYDPYMLVHSHGNMNYRIKQFYTQKWNFDAFKKFVDSQAYIYNNRSWSYIGRFYNSKDFQDCCGVLTTINQTEYDRWPPGGTAAPDPGWQNTSFIDCEYFSYAATLISCRQNDQNLVYGVKGIFSTPSFPFTITHSFGIDYFNLSESDLKDIYASIS